jgi:hypothetical protein
MFQSVLTLILSLQLIQVPSDEIRSALAHAEALYYGARFTEAIQLLERIDDLLETRSDRREDKLATKLQLALAHIALNDTNSARTFLVDVFALDANYQLDPKQFSPKVLELADQAKGDTRKRLCDAALADGQKSLASSNPAEVLALMDSLEFACPALTRVADEAADIAYKNGLEAFRSEDLPAALERFQIAANLSSSHEMAKQYVDLTLGKLQIAAGKLALQWQKELDSKQWKQAADTYQRIAGIPSTEEHVAQMNSTYLKVLDPLVESWNQSCTRNDEAGMSVIRSQVSDLIPHPEFAQETRARMIPCTRTAPPPEQRASLQPLAAKAPTSAPKAAASMPMEFAQALVHLKSRVYPDISPQVATFLRNSQVVVHVKVRINQDGSVTPKEATGGNLIINDAVSDAVAQWKFSPIRDQAGVRCVDTEIMMNLSMMNR